MKLSYAELRTVAKLAKEKPGMFRRNVMKILMEERKKRSELSKSSRPVQ